MYARPFICGIDPQKAWSAATTRTRMEAYGHNTGNIVFCQALLRSIRDAKLGGYGPSADDVSESDVVVIAAANWIRVGGDLGWLGKSLEKHQLPVVIVGLGTQAEIGGAIPDLPPQTVRALKMLAERSTSMSVRGAFTAKVLAHYGISNVVVTGCPSLLLAGANAPKAPRLRRIEWRDCAIHATRSGFHEGLELEAFLYRQAIKHDADLILQSEAPELSSLWPGADRNMLAQMELMLPSIYQTDLETARSYLARRGKVYGNVDDWRTELSQKQFCVGTRIHGTIAALVAGANATLIARDARTLEMARAMNLPYVKKNQINTARDLSLERLYSPGGMRKFQYGYPGYRKRFVKFFKANGLRVTPELARMSLF